MEENNRQLVEILSLCLKIDAQAYQLYNKVAAACSDEKMKIFWNRLAKDERDHVEFWSRALKLAEKELLPNVFEDPGATCKKFEKLLEKILLLIKDIKDYSDISETISISYRLEFLMINPEFATMFHVFRNLEGVDSFEEDYERHISGFIEGLLKYGEKIPDADILGETLQALWTDNRRLARESTYDILTNLLNRRGFFNTVNPIVHLASRKKFKATFLMIDIDNFKKVNDSHGHQKGDEILKFVSSVISSGIRKSDIAGRYGGEEFIIYADCKDPGSIMTLAEKLRYSVERKTEETLGLKVTISIGASSGFIGSNVEQDMMSLIHDADINLYKAKMLGRNKVVG